MEKDYTGIYQLDNGFWGYRYSITIEGKKKDFKKSKDDSGNPFKTKNAAYKARKKALSQDKIRDIEKPIKITCPTCQSIYDEYCRTGRNEKAYSTIKKQDSLWNNHIKERFGNRYINEISVAEINDYLAELYYVTGYAYRYVEGFLKIFYLIFGQAYSRNYLDIDTYNKLCLNKNTKIHMPKLKVDDELDIVIFNQEQLEQLDEYFTGTNAETAYLLGRYCGLRISECYGLKWADIDMVQGTIHITQQMQYQDGLIKLVPLKTRNAKRTLYMNDILKTHFTKLLQEIETYKVKFNAQREQNQTTIIDIDGSPVSSLELVNSLPDGKIQTLNSIKYHAKKITKQLGFHFRYHYLRHTYGTLLADLNTPTHLLCNQMGHASSKVTERYYLGISHSGIDILKQNLNAI